MGVTNVIHLSLGYRAQDDVKVAIKQVEALFGGPSIIKKTESRLGVEFYIAVEGARVDLERDLEKIKQVIAKSDAATAQMEIYKFSKAIDLSPED